MNFTKSVLEKAALAPHKPALVFGERIYSYGELTLSVKQYARLLTWLGVRKGDRVAIQLPNCAEFVFLHLATMLVGAITLPLNTGYKPEEIDYFLEDSGSRLFFTDDEKPRSGSDGAGSSEKAEIARIIYRGEDSNSPSSLKLLLQESQKSFEEGAGTEGADHAADSDVSGVTGGIADSATGAVDATEGNDIALLCYTSGTTGKPKGAMITHGNLLSNTRALQKLWRWTEEDILLCVLPMFHIHGLCVALHGALNAVCKVIIHDKFDPVKCFKTIEENKCTMFMAVPTIYFRLMEIWPELKPAPDLASMRVFISGSAPLSEELFARFYAATGFRILERYGMTETQMIVSNPYEQERRIPQSVGYPLPGVQVRVASDTGLDVTPGEVGEVLVKGENVFRGYWQMPEKTKDSFLGDWFRTGDLGYQDAKDGMRLYLVGRAKELIISGGYNIYPKEVEDVLGQHSAVLESAVIGVSDREFGEKVVAAVVLKSGDKGDIGRSDSETTAETTPKAASKEQLIAFCKEKLAGYKCPKEIIFLDELPRNALGKVQKHLITEAK